MIIIARGVDEFVQTFREDEETHSVPNLKGSQLRTGFLRNTNI